MVLIFTAITGYRYYAYRYDYGVKMASLAAALAFYHSKYEELPPTLNGIIAAGSSFGFKTTTVPTFGFFGNGQAPIVYYPNFPHEKSGAIAVGPVVAFSGGIRGMIYVGNTTVDYK